MADTIKDVQNDLREALRKAFPHHRFSVDALKGKERGKLNVSWTNGPMIEKVQSVYDKFTSRTSGITGIRKMTNGAKELALSILVENNRKVVLVNKNRRLNTALDKEIIENLSGGQYKLEKPQNITDAIRQVFNQMDV